MKKMIERKAGTALRRPGRMERLRAAAAAWTILGILAVLAIPAIILMMLITGIWSWVICVKKRIEMRRCSGRRNSRRQKRTAEVK